MLTPGTYKLCADLKNPIPDKRHKHDWTEFPVWKAGWEFLIEGEKIDGTDRYGTGRYFTKIMLVGHRWTHHAVNPGHEERYAALEAALVPCAQSDEAFLAALRVQDGFAQWLLMRGKLDRDTFRALWTEYEDDDGESAPSVTNSQVTRLLPEGAQEGGAS